MKRAGGGFDASYKARTAVNDTAHIIVAAELTNNAADVGQSTPRRIRTQLRWSRRCEPRVARPRTEGAIGLPSRKKGWIKSVLGFRQFRLRGLHRVQDEFKLVCLALNRWRMGAMKAV